MFILLNLCIKSAHSQYTRINGQVISKKKHLPIENASIKIDHWGCTTDKSGNFTLTISNNVLNEGSLHCSCVGYISRTLNVRNLTGPLLIELEDSVAKLPEVIISTAGKTIVEKAIARIPLNYPDKPFILSGILRLNSKQANGYNYNNDAVIEVYTSSYKTSATGYVKLIKNRMSIKTGQQFDSLQAIKWASAYNAAINYDFVLTRSEFIQLKSMKYFTYSLTGSTELNGKKVYVIDLFSHENIRGVNYREMSGTLYIDTINYALVSGSFKYKDIKPLFYRRQKEFSVTIVYAKQGTKWRLKTIQREMEYEPVDNVRGHSSINFVATSTDTADVHKFSYDEIIQNRDITQQTNKFADSIEWKKYDSLFVKAETENTLQPVKNITIDTLNSQVENYSYSFKQRMQDLVRLIHDRYRFGISVSQFPVSILPNQVNVSETAKYALGFIGQFQLTKTLFFQFDGYFNLGIAGIKNKQSGYYLGNLFTINRNHRPVFLSAVAGYNKLTFSNTGKNIKSSFNNWALGSTIGLEITHKLNVFIGGAYNYNFSKSASDDFFIQPIRISSSAGIIYKL